MVLAAARATLIVVRGRGRRTTSSTMRRLLIGLCLLALPSSVGCGGKSEGEGGPSGAGAGGAGGAGGGASATAGGPTSDCPAERPSRGAACNFSGGQCNYAVDKCSSVGFQCASGVWSQVVQGDGASYDCNSFQAPNLPNDGDSCECFGQLDCYLNDCSGRGQLHAICDNTSWHVRESACPYPCGSSSCALGEVCVADLHVLAFTCVPDQCARASQTLACDCAGSPCSKSEQCAVASHALVCTCPTCH